MLQLLRLRGSLVARILEPSWFRSQAVLAHARAFFPEAEWFRTTPLPGALPPAVAEYLAYVLLDFAVVDEAHGEAALAHVWTQARAMGLEAPFEQVVRRELRLTGLEERKRRFPSLLERAAAQALAALR